MKIIVHPIPSVKCSTQTTNTATKHREIYQANTEIVRAVDAVARQKSVIKHSTEDVMVYAGHASVHEHRRRQRTAVRHWIGLYVDGRGSYTPH